MALWLSGIAVSKGVAIGRVHRSLGSDLKIPEYKITPTQLPAEIARLKHAIEAARAQLREVKARIPRGTPADIAAFVDTHLLMLEDISLEQEVRSLIQTHYYNAEWALRIHRDALAEVFEQMDDAYLSARRDDVNQIIQRVQRILLNQNLVNTQNIGDITNINNISNIKNLIWVADDISPADIILLSQQSVIAFVTEGGGPLSHTAILARSLGIPAVVGVHQARRLLLEGETIAVDGHQGHVLAEPDDNALEYYRALQTRDAEHKQALIALRHEPAVDLDGEKIDLLANIDGSSDVQEAEHVGCVGVGLYRTEFLYMNRSSLPSEEEQYLAYKSVLEATRHPVTIRTLDLGADKQAAPGAHQLAAAGAGRNPALGLRAIRLCLKETSIFRVQLRALLRASVHGALRIMLPMISSVTEFLQAKQIFAEVRDELAREGHILPVVPLGVMIEVPAAALATAYLAKHADFFSIGTNDLIQYTLAIDRIDDEVNYLYDPLHPAVLQLIAMTIRSGRKAGISVSMCGEMAGDSHYTALLLGMGLREFSMHPSAVLEVKRVVRKHRLSELVALSNAVLACDSTESLQTALAQLDVFG